jgi:flagellar L-ring protein FlgH
MKLLTWIFSVLWVGWLAPLSFAEDVNLDTYQPLVSDVKSYAVGEPIVVIVVESTVAEASAGTGVEKNTGIAAGISKNGRGESVGMKVDANDEGSGRTSRKGKVTTQLSATIIEILENGMLKIKGSQDITINGEQQKVLVNGLIRASDISKDNTVFSYQLANVQLEISGEGDISEAQKQNIFYRFFSWIGVL